MKQFDVKDLHGVMSWGLEWEISPWSGDFLVHDAEYGWVEPSGIAFTDDQNDEFFDLCLYDVCEKLEDAARKWGEEFGQAFIEQWYVDDEENLRYHLWKEDLDWPAFLQVLDAAGFYGDDDMNCAVEALFGYGSWEGAEDEDEAEWLKVAFGYSAGGPGWLGKIIYEAGEESAWDELQRLKEADNEEEE